MTKHIVDQDRENVYKVVDQSVFFSEVNIMDGIFYGLNLKMDSYLLGTFDTPLEIVNEIKNIMDNGDEVYYVNGYCEGV